MVSEPVEGRGYEVPRELYERAPSSEDRIPELRPELLHLPGPDPGRLVRLHLSGYL